MAFDTFSSEIEEISDDQLDKLFSSSPDTTVNANNVQGTSVEGDNKEEEKDKLPAKKAEPVLKKVEDDSTIEDVDLDKFFAESSDKTEEKEGDSDSEEVEDEVEEDKKSSKVKSKSTTSKDKETVEAPQETGQVLKSTVDYLIEQGYWADFDGREDLEDIDDKTYAEIAAKQDEYRLNQFITEALGRLGPYGKALFEYEQKGGDPSKLLGIFKSQEERKSRSLDTPEGQKDTLTDYYKRLGWKPEKIHKQLERLEVNDELEDEAKDAEEALNDLDKKEEVKLQREQEAYNRTQAERQEAFQNKMSSTIDSLSGIPKTKKEQIKDFIFNYDVPLQNGQKVNKLYLKFAEIQSDPEKYIDFVQYVMDSDEYKKKLGLEKSNEAVEKAFKFIKRSASGGSKKGSSHLPISRTESSKKEVPLNWGF